ncbi:zinc-finger protein [Saitoella coloradoensis]
MHAPHPHCHWDSCNHQITTPDTRLGLVEHVKTTHLEQAHGHHQCLWVSEDILGSSDVSQEHVCNACFPTAEALSEHVRDAHVGSRKAKYECRWLGCDRLCDERPFTQRQKILRHLQTHTGDRPHKCPICGHRFAEEGVLKQHMRTHTGERPFVCSVCSKCFSASTALSVHMRTHTGDKPLICKFPGCGKRFSESSNLAKHVRTHTSERPYKCQVTGCGKAFQRPDQLKRHAKVHKGQPAGHTKGEQQMGMVGGHNKVPQPVYDMGGVPVGAQNMGMGIGMAIGQVPRPGMVNAGYGFTSA